MSLISRKRHEKKAPLREDDPWSDDTEAAEKPVRTCVQKPRLFSQKRESKTTATSGANRYGLDGVRGDYRGEIKESMRTIKRGDTRGAGEGKEDAAQALPSLIAKARISFKRRQEKEDAKPKKPRKVKMAKLDQLWFVLVTEKFPRCVPPLWDAKHRALAKSITNRIGPENIGPFIKWSVENWTAVMQTSFKWMTASPPPPVPALAFLSKFLHVFTEHREKLQDAPLQLEHMVKGLNMTKREEPRRSANTTPVPSRKLTLPKKDLGATVIPSPSKYEWRD